MSLFDDSSKFWKEIQCQYVGEASGKIADYIRALSQEYSNGGVLFQQFRITSRFHSTENSDEDLFLSLASIKLFNLPIIREKFGNYQVNADFDFSKGFFEMPGYDLPGHLARILQNGGAYSSPKKDMKSFYLALDAALEMTLGDLNRGRILACESAWSDFFHDVAWDVTLVVYRPEDYYLGILLATDVD